jgi:hypothetical protein
VFFYLLPVLQIPELTPEILSAEREQSMKRNKESLKKEAQGLNVKVNCYAK